MNSTIKKIAPHFIGLLICMAIAAIFYAPEVFNNKTLKQGDVQKAVASQTEIFKELKETGEHPLWTNSMFGGMPVYQIHFPDDNNHVKSVLNVLLLKRGMTSPFAVTFLAMFFTYLLMIVLKVDWRIATGAAIAYGLSTYHIDLAEAGHATKLLTLAILPGMIAGVFLAYRGKYLFGAMLFAFTLTMQILANHYQITYYSALCFLILGLVFLIDTIKTKRWKPFLISTGALILAVVVTFLCTGTRLLSTQEYATETIRGKSELVTEKTQNSIKKEEGLTADYAFGWSLGIGETMTLLAPQAYGGGTNQDFTNTKTYALLKDKMQGSPEQIKRSVANMFYHGDQPFVGSPIYFGAIVIFLFFLGAFIVKGSEKVWLIAATIFMISIAWGDNFFLNLIFFDTLPMFNKFRAPTMALGLAQMTAIILGFMGLQKFFDKDISKAHKKKALVYGGGIAGGLCMLLVLISGMMDFGGARDAQVFGNAPQYLEMLNDERASLLRADAFRSLMFIAVAFAMLWFALKGKLKAIFAIAGISLFALLDIWLVNNRVLGADNWKDQNTAQKVAVQATPVDTKILQDSDIHYRVMDLRQGGQSMNNANTSHFHKSIGGYHAAKLVRIQDIYDRYAKPNMLAHLNVWGMFNVKYIIQDNNTPRLNPEACGHAWFVPKIEIVESPDQEFAGLANLKPKEKVLINKEFASGLENFQPNYDSTATITMTSYNPDNMVYSYKANSDQFIVFPEMYYPPSKGWKMYLDDEPYEDFVKVNYTLRGLKVPAGSHTLNMKFEPDTFSTFKKIAGILSILLILGFIAVLAMRFRGSIAEAVQAEDIEADKVLRKTVRKEPKGKAKKKSKK